MNIFPELNLGIIPMIQQMRRGNSAGRLMQLEVAEGQLFKYIPSNILVGLFSTAEIDLRNKYCGIIQRL
jgi:hypothetical protein